MTLSNAENVIRLLDMEPIVELPVDLPMTLPMTQQNGVHPFFWRHIMHTLRTKPNNPTTRVRRTMLVSRGICRKTIQHSLQ